MLLTTDDIAIRFGPLSMEETELATETIDECQAQVEAYLGTSVRDTPGDRTEKCWLSPGARYVALDEGPALTGLVVTVDDEEIDVTSYGGYVDLGATYDSGEVEISYYGGPTYMDYDLTRIKAVLIGFTVRVFARYKERLGGIASYGIEGQSVKFESAELTERDMAALAPYRKIHGMGRTW